MNKEELLEDIGSMVERLEALELEAIVVGRDYEETRGEGVKDGRGEVYRSRGLELCEIDIEQERVEEGSGVESRYNIRVLGGDLGEIEASVKRDRSMWKYLYYVGDLLGRLKDVGYEVIEEGEEAVDYLGRVAYVLRYYLESIGRSSEETREIARYYVEMGKLGITREYINKYSKRYGKLLLGYEIGLTSEEEAYRVVRSDYSKYILNNVLSELGYEYTEEEEEYFREGLRGKKEIEVYFDRVSRELIKKEMRLYGVSERK